ncbi:MAG: hypothetical protein ACUVQZ_05720 [Candidatus Caldatribacteriaceae bacterium]
MWDVNCYDKHCSYVIGRYQAEINERFVAGDLWADITEEMVKNAIHEARELVAKELGLNYSRGKADGGKGKRENGGSRDNT